MESLNGMEVSDLVARCQKGDSEAWTMIVNQYGKLIYNMALNFSGDRDEAADITQDVFMKVYRNLKKFSGDSKFTSWIMRISKNHCIDYWRKNRKRLRVGDVEDDMVREDRTPEDHAVTRSQLNLLRRYMRRLHPDLRLLLIMRDVQDFSYQEMADHFNIPLGTVKSRINRARLKLARSLAAEGHDHDM